MTDGKIDPNPALHNSNAANNLEEEVEPPPSAIEPDGKLTTEEAEQVRRAYLLKRFWISARGFWGRHGGALAWPCTIALLALIGVNVGFQYGLNIWNRGLFDAIEKRDASTVYFLAALSHRSYSALSAW